MYITIYGIDLHNQMEYFKFISISAPTVLLLGYCTQCVTSIHT